MDIGTFRDLVGEDAWRHGKSLVRAAYPDPKCTFGDGLIARVICALPSEARQAIGAARVTADVAAEMLNEAQVGIADAEMAQATYFIAFATHTRTGQGAHSFTAHLPMVRVKLPRTGLANLNTEFGIVYAGDHKLPNVETIARKYAKVLDFEVGDVYLTTPARYLGARFAAVATYELFDTDGARRTYILEAGMATGESMVLFYSVDGKDLKRRSWYQPTPFSSDENWYGGHAEFDVHGPTNLLVSVCTKEEIARYEPHLTVRVEYHIGVSPARIFPSKLTAEAGLRVAAIAAARGTDNPLFKLLAPFGRALSWEKTP